MHETVFHALADAARRGEPVSLGLISVAKGSSPQKVGAKALFYPDGRIVGTIGGGCLEAEIQRRALFALQSGRAEEFELVLDHDFGWDDGLICGGKVQGLILPQAQATGEGFWRKLAARSDEITWGVTRDFAIQNCRGEPAEGNGWRYREAVFPKATLWIAGAGHIAQAVAPLAAQLDFAVTVFDDRPALANGCFFSSPVTLVADSWEVMLKLSAPQQNAFGLIVTRGHRHDALVLREWLGKGFVFLGMIGSKRKARMIFDHFLQDKIATEEQLARVACPVGIDIQSKSVMEIAVSIMAQFVQKRAEVRQ